ncbi:MAG: DUF58 domain-containing protein, partial [Verrucomicrobia bacterium]
MGRRLATAWRQRLTPAGKAVVVTLGLALCASDPEQTLAWQLAGVLLGLLGMSWIMTPFFRGRFDVERHPPRLVTAGEPFHLRVRVWNLGRRRERGLEYVEDLGDPPVTLAELEARMRPGRYNRSFRLSPPLPPIRMSRTEAAPLPELPPGGAAEVVVPIVAFRRGPLVLRGGLVGRPDPFGLVRSFCRVRRPHTVLVLPRRYPLPPMALPGATAYQRGSMAMAAGVGESEEFVALREYRRGDSLRRIHWRSTARLGEPVVKEFQDEFFTRHALVLDTFCEAAADALFEEAVAVAASFACTIPDLDSLLDLMFVGPQTVCVTSGRGLGHAQQLLEVLAAARPCRENRFDQLRSLVLEHADRLSGVILVALEWDRRRRELVRRLRALRIPVWALVLRAPFEKQPFRPGPPGDQPDRLVVLEAGRVEA